MEKKIVAVGKTIDLAVESALAQLGLTRDDISYEVLALPKSGFLGFGAQPAKIQVTYEAPDPVVEPEKPKSALGSASRSKPKAKPVAEKKPEPAAQPVTPAAEKPVEAPKQEKKAEKVEKKQEKKTDKAEKKQEKKAEKKPAAPKEPREVKAPRVYTPAAPGSTEEKIEVFIKGLLEHMNSQAIPHAFRESDNTYFVELVGDDLGYLIGRRGDTLDAIQHLANYTINRGVEGHIRINVDAESYREKREDSLRRYARKKAQQVLKARRRTTLEPMNAYERHVIHAALQDMENITTHSTGTEPNRRVVIEYVR
ncbi:MAG: Jag N-terminal domain-containing protein [Firmicutes bacterium]|nr:Jag N-terminal domain-containing protein [Bacillota bacterium]